MKKIIAIFIIRFELLLIVAIVASTYLSYRGFFPYREILDPYKIPQYISGFANFDGVHYIKIAERGYDTFEQAFFPLFPLLIRAVVPFFSKNYFWAGFFVSNVAFILGCYFFMKLMHLYKKTDFRWLFCFMLTFPTAFFFSLIYTESLFFLLFMSSIYFLYTQKYNRAMILAFLCSLTRLPGVFLVIPFFFYFFPSIKKISFKKWLVIFSPLSGLALYSLYLAHTTGDPFFFINSQPAFGANRSTSLVLLPQVYYRYLKIFLTASFSFAYVIALVELITFSLVFIIGSYELWRSFKKKDYFEFSFACVSILMILLPSLTGTFSSIPRYALFSFSTYFFLSRIKSKTLKLTFALLFIFFQTLLFAYFIQGYFVS